jgi:hypothetical protein
VQDVLHGDSQSGPEMSFLPALPESFVDGHVPSVGLEEAPQLPFIEHEHSIQAFSPD